MINFSVQCNSHNQIFNDVDYWFYLNDRGVPCCFTNQMSLNFQAKKALKTVEARAKERGHTISNFQYTGVSSKSCFFTVTCLKHQQTYTNIYYRRYKAPSKSGSLPCCKERPSTTGRSRSIDQWKMNICHQIGVKIPTCQLTGLIGSNNHKIEGHHLYGETGFPLLRNLPQNGVLVMDVIHRTFHTEYSQKWVITPKHFVVFLSDLLTNTPRLESLLKTIGEDSLNLNDIRKNIAILIRYVKSITNVLNNFVLNPETIPKNYRA